MNNLFSIPNKFNRYLIFVISIAPFFAFLIMTYLDISPNRILQLLSYIGVILIFFLKRKRQRINFPKYLLFYLLFIIYVFFSTFVLLDREFKVMYLFSNFMIGGFNMMLIIENISISKKQYYTLLSISKNILIIAIIVIIYQQVVNPNFFVRMDLIDEEELLAGTKDRLPSIYSWIGGLTMGFGFVPVFILMVEELGKRKKKILIWIIGGIIYIFLTKARWVMLNGLLVFVILFIHHKNKTLQFLKMSFLIPLIFGISIITLDSAGINASGIIKDRIFETDKKSISETTAGTRILAFKALNELFWDHPILGRGNVKYGMGGTGENEYKLREILKGRSSQMHVGYASLLYIYGLIGTFLFLGFLILLLKKLYKNGKITRVWAPFLGFLGFALANLTLVTFSIFEMGLIIVLVADRYYGQYINFKIKSIDA